MPVKKKPTVFLAFFRVFLKSAKSHAQRKSSSLSVCALAEYFRASFGFVIIANDNFEQEWQIFC